MPSSPIDGPRNARLDEIDDIIALNNRVFRTDEGLPPTMGHEFPLFLSPKNASNLFVMREDDRLVSHVGVFEQTLSISGVDIPVACVGAVCTHPEHRGRGHAGRLVDLAIERARAAGNVLMPISGSAGLYIGRGARAIHPAFNGSITADRLSDASTDGVRRFRPDDVAAVVAIHNATPVHYIWEAATTEAMIGSQLGMGARAWVHESAGNVDGWLLVRDRPPWSRAESNDERQGEIVEFAGSVSVVAALCGAAVRERCMQTLSLAGLHGEHSRHALLNECGTVARTGPSPWTMKVLNLPRIVEVWRPTMPAAIGVDVDADDDSLTISEGKTTVRIDDPDSLFAVLFSKPTEAPGALAPLSSAARAALMKHGSVPLCSYGLNYV